MIYLKCNIHDFNEKMIVDFVGGDLKKFINLFIIS